MAHFDAIVVGTGGVGSAALWQLARRGGKVLGLDRFAPPHQHGSSHGQSRIIRQAYFEHPDYTPLLLESYRLWNELAHHINRKLTHEVGVLEIGRPDGEVVSGALLAARMHGLSLEQLSAKEIGRRWPAFRVPDSMVGIFETHAGYLLVEACIEAHLDAARGAGAEIQSLVEVESWQPGPPVCLQTSAGDWTADRLIVSAGAWAGALLDELKLDLEVRRKSSFWYPPQPGYVTAHEELPCFLYELPSGVYYGVPQIDQRGVKIAEHSGGTSVSNPLQVDRGVDPRDAQRIEAFVGQHLPQLAARRCDHSVCLYTMSHDHHFIVDRHPEHPHVVFAAGLSGHGFKFTPVLGRALAELALDGKTELPIGFLARR